MYLVTAGGKGGGDDFLWVLGFFLKIDPTM
jgi:hypothetical protein